LALGRWFRTGKQLDQCGFACAIYPDERDPVAALDHEADVPENFLFPRPISSRICLRYALELSHDPSAGLGLREREMDGLLFGRNLDPLDLFEFLDPALHLLRFGGRVAE